MSWYGAKAFTTWLSDKTGKQFDLLTETQWEYAARAGSSTTYYFGGDDAEIDDHVWYSLNCNNSLHPVKKLKPNKWGLYDMLGNVQEWCRDWYHADYYDSVLKNGAVNPENTSPGTYRSMRGGAWSSTKFETRCAARFSFNPQERGNYIGFRITRNP